MLEKKSPHFQKSDRSDKSDWSDLSDLSDFTEWEIIFRAFLSKRGTNKIKDVENIYLSFFLRCFEFSCKRLISSNIAFDICEKIAG